MSQKTILIVRPEEDSAEFITAIKERGYDALVESVLTISYTKETLPSITPETPLVFTSANGVRAFGKLSDERGHPVYTVGRNTADEARNIGFTHIEAAAGTVEDLSLLLTKTLTSSLIPALYVRGEHISSDLAGILSKKEIFLQEFVGYAAISAENLSINLLNLLDLRKIEAVMVFSKRGAQVFADLILQYDRAVRLKTTKALCMSDSVVHSVSVLPFHQTLVAEKPDRYGMMKLLEQIPPNVLHKV